MDHLVQDTPDSSFPANTVIWKVTLDRDRHRGIHGHRQRVYHLYRYRGMHRGTQCVHHLCTGTACAQTHTHTHSVCIRSIQPSFDLSCSCHWYIKPWSRWKEWLQLEPNLHVEKLMSTKRTAKPSRCPSLGIWEGSDICGPGVWGEVCRERR